MLLLSMGFPCRCATSLLCSQLVQEPFDSDLGPFSPHYRFYYDCLMRPNARSVLTALKRTKDMDYDTIATGHGPMLRYNLTELVGR